MEVRRVGVDFRLEGDRLDRLHRLGEISAALPNQTDTAGNLSLRDEAGIIVTTSGCYIKNLRGENFVRVERLADDGLLEYTGEGVPSSESLMHYLIYQQTDSGAVAHSHYLLTNRQAEDLDVAIIPPQEYGSVELARKVAEACKLRPIVYIQRHGIVIHGRDVEDCLGRLQAFIRHFEETHRG